MITKPKSKRLTTLLVLLIISIFNAFSGFSKQDDTVKIYNVSTSPLIDGVGTDDCWQKTTWQTIDQVWINYGEHIGASDYYGRYKVIWSSKDNLLYFLVEITDDVAIGGFDSGETPDVYNYDIIEVFIDENKSGGPHVGDNEETGENAENAFGYHIYADFPAEGNVTTSCWVGDMPVPHTDHFPEFALKKTGNLYTREFSLKVFDDTYEEENKEASRVQLSAGKIMGLSLAYCDNDDNDGQRDNFFGSVWVSESNYNNHWMLADDFGAAKLYPEIITKIADKNLDLSTLQLYPNPASDFLNIKSNSEIKHYELIDLTGRTLRDYQHGSSGIVQIPLTGLIKGIYFVKVSNENREILIKKIIKI